MNVDSTGVSQLREVRATFSDPAQMQQAVSKLSMSGFDRADLSLPAANGSLDDTAPETAATSVSTEDDARQARTLGTSTMAAVAALGAVGATIATGGAAAPAIAAALVAGGVAGGATYAATGAAAASEQEKREELAVAGDLILSVRTPTAAKQAVAIDILREAGATQVERVGS